MANSRSLIIFSRENRAVFLMLAIGLFLIEVEIFAFAAMKSGSRSRLQVFNRKNHLIYETDGQDLSRFDKYYFEKTFGPFDQYEARLVTEKRPFPFRAWFSAAIGIPVAAMLVFAFMARAYAAIWGAGPPVEKDASDTEKIAESQGRLGKILHQISRFNIFTIGFLLLMAVLAYWVLPNLAQYLGKISLETIVRYKWVFLGLTVTATALLVWVIYLRYLLAKKALESQTELSRYRMQLEMGVAPEATPVIEANRNKTIEWLPDVVKNEALGRRKESI